MITLVARVAALSLLVLGMVASPAAADDLADARAFIGQQLVALKAADVAAVKAGLTERHRAKVTPELLAKAKKQVATITVDELVGSVAKANGGLKIKMANGRSLTTLLKVKGAWLADTLWFK